MKMWLKMLVFAACGFVSSILLIKVFKGLQFDFSQNAVPIVIAIFVIISFLWMRSFVLFRQIKVLKDKDVYGDEEDEVDVLKYKKIADVSFLASAGAIFSVLALCITVITDLSLTFIVAALVVFIVSYMFASFIPRFGKWMYPERDLPNSSERNFSEKLLVASDEGEKHVILIGLYKSYNLFSLTLVIGIFLATFYSVVTENSQLFSIVVMSMVLILAQGKYYFSIRNK